MTGEAHVRFGRVLILGILAALVLAETGAMLGVPVVQEARADLVKVMGATLPGGPYLASAIWDGQAVYIFEGVGASSYLNRIVRYDPGADSTTEMGATLPSSRWGMAAVWDGQYAYLFGGTDDECGCAINNILRYDPATDVLVTMGASLPGGRYFASAFYDGRFAYLLGGTEGNDSYPQPIIRYDPQTDSVTLVQATLPEGRYHASSVWDGQYGYLFGGLVCGSCVYSDEILRYDPQLDTITTLETRLPTARMGTSAVWDGQNAYILGGQTFQQNLDEIVKYAPETATMSLMEASLPQPRVWGSAVWTGRFAYSVGGAFGSTTIYRYDPYVPSSPIGSVATAGPGRGEISFTWAPPNDSGGSAVTKYVIYSGADPAMLTFREEVFDSLGFSDSGLPDTVTRYYQVAAVNSFGEGSRSALVSATTFSFPTAPRDPEASPSIGGEIGLSWQPPADDGGTPITNYRIYRGETSTGLAFLAEIDDQTTYTDSDLDPGQTFYYAVSAVNIVGEGPQSIVVNATLPGDVLLNEVNVSIAPSVPILPAPIPGTPGQETPDIPGQSVPVATVEGRPEAGNQYCVYLTPEGDDEIQVACANTFGVPVPPVGPTTIVATPPVNVPDVPPTSGIPAGSFGATPEITADFKVRYYYEPARVVQVASLLNGQVVVKAPIAPSLAAAQWLAANANRVDLQVLVTAYADGEPIQTVPPVVSIPALGQVLGAAHESIVLGEPPI